MQRSGEGLATAQPIRVSASDAQAECGRELRCAAGGRRPGAGRRAGRRARGHSACGVGGARAIDACYARAKMARSLRLSAAGASSSESGACLWLKSAVT